MRHRVASKRLKRTSGELKALLVNQSKQLFTRGSVTTTLQKAKLVRPFAEKLITTAKESSFNNVKRVQAVLSDDGVTRTLFTTVAPKFVTRPGGYTRIIKLGNRGGDNAQLARIELVEKIATTPAKGEKSEKAKKEVKKENKDKGKKSVLATKLPKSTNQSKATKEKVKKDAKN